MGLEREIVAAEVSAVRRMKCRECGIENKFHVSQIFKNALASCDYFLIRHIKGIDQML